MTSIIKADNISTVSGSGTLSVAAGTTLHAPGHVLQVQHAVQKGTLNFGSSSFADMTGLSITFTPLASNSKLLILPMINAQGYGMGNTCQIRPVVIHGSTTVADFGVADTAGSRTRSMMGNFAANTTDGNHMQSPTTGMVEYTITNTSQHIVKMQMKTQGGATVYVNRNKNDNDNSDWGARGLSSLTIWEIAQ